MYYDGSIFEKVDPEDPHSPEDIRRMVTVDTDDQFYRQSFNAHQMINKRAEELSSWYSPSEASTAQEVDQLLDIYSESETFDGTENDYEAIRAVASYMLFHQVQDEPVISSNGSLHSKYLLLLETMGVGIVGLSFADLIAKYVKTEELDLSGMNGVGIAAGLILITLSYLKSLEPEVIKKVERPTVDKVTERLLDADPHAFFIAERLSENWQEKLTN